MIISPPFSLEKPWLGQRAAMSPDDPAIFCGSEIVSFRQLYERSLLRAETLKSLGVGRGDIIASLLENGLCSVELFHAAQLSGVTLLPLNARLTAVEAAFQLDEARPKILHAEGEDLLRLATEVCEKLVDPPLLLTDSGYGKSPLAPGKIQNFMEEVPWAILYTSGTTGRPKGVPLTVRHFGFSAMASLSHLGIKKDDRWLACVPLFHIAGLSILTKSVLSGAGVVLHNRFDAGAVSEALETQHITLMSLVPTMLYRLIEVRLGCNRTTAPFLRAVLVGGASCSEELHQKSLDIGIPVLRTYGLTEACSQVATVPPADDFDKPSLLPEPLQGVEIKIVNDDGEPLGPCQEGEILVRGGMVMDHYFNRVEESAKILKNGWLHTGDIGFLDKQGGLCVLSRRSDLIVSGGENIYPAEVEACLSLHPVVEDVCVSGEDDPEFGQRVVAWVVLRVGEEVSEEGLQLYCRESLAGYKIPRRVVILKQLPRNASGKIMKAHLKSIRL
ncbi:MAG: o-succinylbenzoate--CoA ligase [Deltaproteobacteria bacterium]|nr:o-succinylbenzoate--CoA ligase [Deltaproteobacteria bacterium]